MKKILLLAMLFPAIAFAKPVPCRMGGENYVADVSVNLKNKTIRLNQSTILPLNGALIGGNGRVFQIDRYKGDSESFGFISDGVVVVCMVKDFPKELQGEY